LSLKQEDMVNKTVTGEDGDRPRRINIGKDAESWPQPGQVFKLSVGPQECELVFVGNSTKQPGCYTLIYESEGQIKKVHLPASAVIPK
jgi:hypothetical protein